MNLTSGCDMLDMDEVGLLPEWTGLWNSAPMIPLWFLAWPISDSRII